MRLCLVEIVPKRTILKSFQCILLYLLSKLAVDLHLNKIKFLVRRNVLLFLEFEGNWPNASDEFENINSLRTDGRSYR